MHSDRIEQHVCGASGVHRASARTKLLLAGSFIFGVVITPAPWWQVFVAQAMLVACVLSLSRLPWRMVGARLLRFVPFALVLALGVPMSRGLQGGWDLMLAVLARAIIAFLALIWLAGTTRFDALLAGLRQLRVPILLVAVIGMTVRYLAVLAGELDNMQRARLARTTRASVWNDWHFLPNLIGCLFLRSLDRAERVHQAMLARGWTGEPRSLDAP
jgi:cobalt/nickel transport system permease protein